MEWRIIVPVLCLIGILHVPGNAAQADNTTTAAAITTNTSQIATTNQTTTSSQTAAVNQTATSSQTAAVNQTATSSQTAAVNQTATSSQTAAVNQTATSSQTAAVNQTATSSQTAAVNQTATSSQTAAVNQTATSSQAAAVNQTATSSQTAAVNQTATSSQTAAVNQTTNPTATINQTTTPATAGSTPATTVSTTAAAATAPAKTSSLNLVFSLTQDFKDVYSNLTNPETKQLVDEITSAFSPNYRKTFKNFVGMKIRKFRKGSVVTDSVLEFDNTDSTTPNLTEVKDTFVKTIAAGNFSFKVDNTSISVVEIPTASGTTVTTASTNSTHTSNTTPATTVSTPATTVSTTAAAATTPAKTASLNVVFRLTQDFKDVYSNLTNPETKQLVDEITSAFSPVYKKRFANFLRMIIRSFRKGSVVTDSVLEFDNTNNTSPNVTEVKDTFTEAIKAGNFTFTVDTTSINVTDITTNVSTTTQATTTVSTTAGLKLSEYNVTFKMNETFSSELSNISSSQAVALAKNITVQLDGVFKKGFSNFVRSLIWRFRSGSVFVDALLGFNKNATSPTAAEVVKFIVDSAKNGSFTFTVDSLTVTDPSGTTANRSPVLASMLTALWMTLASLVVSAAMH